MRLAGVALVLVVGVASAQSQEPPPFVTLERAGRETLLGLQASLQLHPERDSGHFGGRVEVFAQGANRLDNGGAVGGYVHLSAGLAGGHAGVSDLEVGAYYVIAASPGTDLVLHAGLSLPTASERDGFLANILTGYERHYDLIGLIPNTPSLKLGATLRTPISASGSFLQADLAVDTFIGVQGDADKFFHANFGLGVPVRGLLLMGEAATTVTGGDFTGTVALGVRLPSPGHPYLAYVVVLRDATDRLGDGWVRAHILSFGGYLGR